MTADDSLDQPSSVLAVLAARYPDWTIWYGEATRHWWALPPNDGRPARIIEAPTVAELVTSIETLKSHPPDPATEDARRPGAARRSRWFPTTSWQGGGAQ